MKWQAISKFLGVAAEGAFRLPRESAPALS